MQTFPAGLFLLLTAAPVAAQPAEKSPPEAFLSARCIAFVRYDGYEPHKKAYDQTVLARVMNDDLGQAIEYCLDQIEAWFVQSDPAWKKVSEVYRAGLAGLWKHGVVLGLELADKDYKGWRLTIVLPQAMLPQNRDFVRQAFEVLTKNEAEPLEVKKRTVLNRTVSEAKNKKDVTFAWWYESPHAIVTIGTLPPEDVIAVADGKAPGLRSTDNFRRVADFTGYETDIRGFVDLRRIVELYAMPPKEAEGWESVSEAIALRLAFYRAGLTGLGTLTVHLGFDGRYQRSTVKVDVVEPAKRVGLLKVPGSGLAWTGRIDGAPIPPDAGTVAVRHIAWERVADEILLLVELMEFARWWSDLRERGWRTFFPFFETPPADPEAAPPPEMETSAVKVRAVLRGFVKEAVTALDTTYLSYDAYSEGPFSLGSVWAIKVKDGKKLEQALLRLRKDVIAAAGDPGLKVETRRYRGMDLVVWTTAGLPVAPTYAVHDGWLVIGLLPQPVKGFVWRSEPGRGRWKQPEDLGALYAKARAQGPASARLGSVHVDDPRPLVSLGLSYLPLLAASLGGNTEPPFDVSKLPHAQAVTEPLFPNVTFFFDDGNALRWESHFSIDMTWVVPFGLYPFAHLWPFLL